MTAEMSATSIAKLFNVLGGVEGTGIEVGEFASRFGSAVVDLGNRTATTEEAITRMALQVAGAGRQIGLTTPQLMAFVATATQLGVQTERGGTSLSRIMQEMMFATTDGGVALEAFAKTSEKTTQQFIDDFGTDANNAIRDFFVGFARMTEQGTLTEQMLKDMGLSGVRVRDVINRMIGSVDTLTGEWRVFDNPLEISNSGWEEQVALQEEAERKFATVQSRIQLLKNQFLDLGITIFDLVKDDIVALIDGIGNAVKWFSDLDDVTKKNMLVFAGLAAAIGPVLVIVGGFIITVGGLIGAFGTLITIVAGAVGAIGTLVSGLPLILGLGAGIGGGR